jgi:hypothetical protein
MNSVVVLKATGIELRIRGREKKVSSTNVFAVFFFVCLRLWPGGVHGPVGPLARPTSLRAASVWLKNGWMLRLVSSFVTVERTVPWLLFGSSSKSSETRCENRAVALVVEYRLRGYPYVGVPYIPS